ncbi:MAG: hypothetical protein KJ015_09785 [Myxococcales bacterium]|nr:hypothetical protein [Myxococcales bacterium]
MAVGLVAELIGDELIRALDRNRRRLDQQAERFCEWLREVSEPPRGLELRAVDGARYSGAVVVQSNRIVLAWLVRHPALPPSGGPPPASPTFASRTQAPLVTRFGQGDIDADDARWDRDWSHYDIGR